MWMPLRGGCVLMAKRFLIAGAILGCLNGSPAANKKNWSLEVTEDFGDDPWIASVRTTKPVDEAGLRAFFEAYTIDPDKAGIPYYFAVKDITNGEIFVIYTDEFKLYPLNTPAQRKAAMQAGIKKGIDAKQVDFVKDELQPDEFAA